MHTVTVSARVTPDVSGALRLDGRTDDAAVFGLSVDRSGARLYGPDDALLQTARFDVAPEELRLVARAEHMAGDTRLSMFLLPDQGDPTSALALDATIAGEIPLQTFSHGWAFTPGPGGIGGRIADRRATIAGGGEGDLCESDPDAFLSDGRELPLDVGVGPDGACMISVNADSLGLMTRRSTDAGRTWSASAPIAASALGDTLAEGVGVPTLAEDYSPSLAWNPATDRYVALFRSTGSAPDRVLRSRDCVLWEGHSLPIAEDTYEGAQLVAGRDGLLLVEPDERGHLSVSHWTADAGRGALADVSLPDLPVDLARFATRVTRLHGTWILTTGWPDRALPSVWVVEDGAWTLVAELPRSGASIFIPLAPRILALEPSDDGARGVLRLVYNADPPAECGVDNYGCVDAMELHVGAP